MSDRISCLLLPLIGAINDKESFHSVSLLVFLEENEEKVLVDNFRLKALTAKFSLLNVKHLFLFNKTL